MYGVTLGRMHLLVWCLILVNLFVYQCADGSRAFLSNNGYSNVLVAIAPNTPRNQAHTIIDNIKVILFEEHEYIVWYLLDR